MIRMQALLRELGERVREARERRGLSLAELARRSQTSRRFLTEVEAGRANPSLAKLAALAGALRLPLGELCDLPLATGALERVALVGLRGAGKSTVGRLLALELEAPFVELDREVEARAGMGLSEIFDLHGVGAYRRLEREALEGVLAAGGRLVIATGGSLVTAPETFARLREACRTVWLSARPEEHLARVRAQGDRRPMAGRDAALSELCEILDARLPLYARCELALDTSGREPGDLARELAERLRG